MSKDFSKIFVLPLTQLKPVEALKKALVQSANEIIDLNRQQLDKGLDATGKSLGKYANFSYKGRLQPVDLNLTGSFRRKFYLIIDEKQTEIKSEDEKEGLLIWMYGKNIHGVPKYLIPNVRALILDDYQKFFKQQLNAGTH